MLNPRAMLEDALHRTRTRLGRLTRKLVLAVTLGICALAAAIYFFSALYQALLPVLGAAGANASLGAALVLVCLFLLVLLRRA